MLSPHPKYTHSTEATQARFGLSLLSRIGRPGKSLAVRFVLCASLIIGIVVSVSFFASTSAQHYDASPFLSVTAGSSVISSFLPPGVEAVQTYTSGCISADTDFVLGDTICAEATGAPGPHFGYRQRRFQWVSPEGAVVQQTEISADPQSDTFTVPTSGALAQVGMWTVRLIKNNGNTVTLTNFFVSDPANFRADLSVGKYGPIEVKSGNNATYSIFLVNRGPNTADNVELTDTVPANMTFVSATQTSGPVFTCSHPSAGGPGTSTCNIASLPRDAEVTFTFIYEVTSGTATGTQILNTVDVSSDTVELRPVDNSATAPVTVTLAGAGGGDCVVDCPEDQTLVAPSGAAGMIVNYDEPVATGASCGAVSCSRPSGSFFDVGTTVVVCAGETGDSCSFSITVQDNQLPTISCPENITVAEDPPGSGGAIVEYPAPVASDNSGIVEVTCTQPSGANFPVGTTTVTCTATDDSGNNASCSFNVTVTGDGCILTCPEDIVVTSAVSSCGAAVTFAPTVTEQCGEVTTSHASGSTFPVGTTTVEVSAGGQSCSFTVTVLDRPPVITCPASITAVAPSGSCSATVDPGTATAIDNCAGGVTISGSRSDGMPITDQNYPVGITAITWTATDSAGNSSSCEQVITVSDPVPPTVSANVPPEDADASCEALIPDISELVTVTYNCTPSGSLTVTQSPVAGTVVGAGSHIITITVIEGDPDGPQTTFTGTTTFTVNDVTPPILTVNGADPLVVECHTSLVDPGATATDACVTPVVTSTNDVNVNVPGSYTITYSTTDGTNTVTATRAVTVVDTIAPVITIDGANPMTVECHTSFSDPGATATDDCAGSIPVTVSGAVNVNVPGTYTLTYTATDGFQSSTATRIVEVVDTTAPTITMTGTQINLWPPNHSYQTINLTQLVASASDGCDGGIDINDVVISKVTSDETENGGGDGNTLNDIVIASNCKSVQLRKERNGGGNGRVYTIHFRATDASGNVTTTTAQVKVPKSQGNGGGAIDSGVQYTVNGTCP